MSGVIQTFLGGKVDVLNPDPDTLLLEDIAHALSNQCRFGGHAPVFYSVAQHSVLCAIKCQALYGDRLLTRTALFHDAAEAYLQDVVRPIKQRLPEYYKIEGRLERVLADKFDFLSPLPKEIKDIDSSMLCTEGAQFFGGQDLKWWETGEYGIHVYPDVHIIPYSPETARFEFMLMAFDTERKQGL